MEYIIATCAGIALAAACGLRVFLPLLVLGLGAKLGLMPLGANFAWLASTPALLALAVATVVEVVVFYVPVLDHALDAVVSPLAMIAGAFAAVAVWPDGTPEYLRWTVGIVAGASVSASTQATTVVTRAASTLTTGGLANFLVSTLEAALAMVTAVVAIVAPVLAAHFVILLAVLLGRWVLRRGKLAPVPAAANP